MVVESLKCLESVQLWEGRACCVHSGVQVFGRVGASRYGSAVMLWVHHCAVVLGSREEPAIGSLGICFLGLHRAASGLLWSSGCLLVSGLHHAPCYPRFVGKYCLMGVWFCRVVQHCQQTTFSGLLWALSLEEGFKSITTLRHACRPAAMQGMQLLGRRASWLLYHVLVHRMDSTGSRRLLRWLSVCMWL